MSTVAGTRLAASLEALASTELPPEYVLVYFPARLLARLRDRLTKGGAWELLTVAEYDTGGHASDERTLPAGRTEPQQKLAAWARERLGYPVHLEPDTHEMQVDGQRGWHTEPLYWITRDN